MSKRTKLKLRNIKLFFSKYILNGRYVVRNILAVTIAVTFIALTVGAIELVKVNKGTEEIEQVADEKTVLVVTNDTQLDTKSITTLKVDLESKQEAFVQANTTNVVSAKNSFADKCVATTDGIEIIKNANEKSDVVGTLPDGGVADIISENGDWYRIKSGAVEGFVSKKSVLTGEAAAKYAKDYYFLYAEVTDEDVCIRSEASKEAEILEPAYMDVKYDVDKSKTTDKWVCVNTFAGDAGYVNADYMKVVEGYPTAIPAEKKTGDSAEENKKSEDETTEDKKSEVTSENDKSTTEASAEETTTEESTTEKKTETTEETTTEVTTTEEATTEETTTEETTEASSGNEVDPGYSNRGAISLSESDINLMASVLTLECGGESYEGQLAVANVIINRYLNGAWGSSIYDVVYAPCQFSVTQSPMLDYYIENGAQSSCVQAVRDAVSGTNNIGSYMYFRPTWNVDTSSLGAYKVIGNHVFY